MQISGLSASNTFSATDVLAIEVNVNGVEKTYKLTGATLAAALASIGSYLKTTNVVNNLTSTAINAPLSANMGKTLEEHIQQLTAKTILSGTTSFSALDNNSYESRALDSLHNSIASKTSGIVELESSGGPVYYTVLFKYTDNYYCGYLSTYADMSSWTSPWIVYRYAYENGTFRIYKAE